IDYIKQNDNAVCGSQRELAKQIGVAYSTFKEVIKLMIDENLLIKEVEGKGRAAITTLKLTNVFDFTTVKNKQKNGPNSYTYRDTVVGGQPSAVYLSNSSYFDTS
ncbi:replication/maintenance protein RepL, partial [Halorubrum sp. AD140]|uniref:replication/maintenance protein RepL n=1 Tax=Halorubrum sp. AD140 TaxID=3050073 RepID=UPI002ACCC307